MTSSDSVPKGQSNLMSPTADDTVIAAGDNLTPADDNLLTLTADDN